MKWMPLADIKVDSPYLRIDSDIESLKRSIETVGLINPVTVNEAGELLAGGRRYSAVKALGWEEIPANVIERGKLEQELISIDENLVRKPLAGLELEECLNRGREIYEMLNPEARKVDVAPEPVASEAGRDRDGDGADDTSFAAVTARKTGLSKRVIETAIRRDALSSARVKEARRDIGASRTNEIIKLEKDAQDKLLPYVQKLPVRAVKALVRSAHEKGIESAIAESGRLEPPPKEWQELGLLTKRLRRAVERVLEEGVECEERHQAPIEAELEALVGDLRGFLERSAAPAPLDSPSESPENEAEGAADAPA